MNGDLILKNAMQKPGRVSQDPVVLMSYERDRNPLSMKASKYKYAEKGARRRTLKRYEKSEINRKRTAHSGHA
ncbi:hypothetical protein BTI247_62390 (plasmid) [Bacillus thuringiensis Bt18247]|uniref:Uncharacterized protein n=1 Tax=Bacillus thuringiensis Bt18247 TaxID=1423143 RepID=A0A9W3SZ09_BACTU|nr:hypothetical protein BTI247_60350 [Bacillus thuringiensis Bt18247]AOM14569.1 hypothetical protein BTI247_62390 [Bacillus thuringiensis Bt18247]